MQNSRELLDGAIFKFVEEHLGYDKAVAFDYSTINDELDKIEGTV